MRTGFPHPTRVFASKHEAFAAAYALATANITPTRMQPRKVTEE